MRDPLEIPVAYYILSARLQSLGCVPGGALVSFLEREEDSSPAKNVRDSARFEPFRSMLASAGSFLDEAQLLLRSASEQEEEAVADTISEFASELEGRARDMLNHTREAAALVLPLVRASQPLPLELLERLIAHIHTIESHYGPCNKSDVLPAPLLRAEPGSKLYPSLARKLEAVCGRSIADLRGREIERFRARLLKGSFHRAFDERRSALANETAASKDLLFAAYAEYLSHSDHTPVGEIVHLETLGPMKVTTWNVLEFPCLGSLEPVFDGVRPVCDAILKGLGRKDAECMNILLDAVRSDVVINRHTERVLSFAQYELMHCGTDVLLLQEVNERVRESI
ncbi:unnamed protein product [Prorocentrum cordatum]|uniref:Uncharacterized protein n=1 Tax=Prorocentrum cordatum TaxID=2364126 RepID=A0ABN9XJS0_9DINO|nr:unnamed protein product [Polarella glacialis]